MTGIAWLSQEALLREWLALPDVNSRQRADLEAASVTGAAIHVAGGIGWARIATTGRIFDRIDAGDVHMVLPVWIGAAPSIYEGVEHPVLVDMLAWRLDNPTVWYYRLGGYGSVLGADALDRAHADSTAIILSVTPLAWLQGGCRGSVLLDECEAAWRAQEADEQAQADKAWWGGTAA